jgi:ABC-2 type transport system permease protein
MFVFILTSVAFLRERVAGTLERLQATPINQIEIIVGYMLGFALFALIQSLIILIYTIYGLKVHYMGNLFTVFIVELLLALMAVNLGVFFSTFARNEFQVVQFIPLVVVTQVFLSGALWAVEDMPTWLQPIAWLMPLTHANYALRDVMIKGYNLMEVGWYVLALIGFTAALIFLASRTIKRQALA